MVNYRHHEGGSLQSAASLEAINEKRLSERTKTDRVARRLVRTDSFESFVSLGVRVKRTPLLVNFQ